MDLTNTREDVPGSGEEPPDFSTLEDPERVLKGGPIRERMLDVVIQLREPTTVATIAERVDCDTETARDYLQWFTEMGVTSEYEGRPVRYARNDSYFRWRRVQQLRTEYTDEAIVDELQEVMASIEDYRNRFDAETPDEVSLLDADEGMTVEEQWEQLTTWQALEQRAVLLDAARRDNAASGPSKRSIDV